LSEADQLLLDTLRTDRWLRPIDLLVRNERLIDFFLRFVGDLLFSQRLREWVQTPAVLMRDENGVNDVTAESFQLTSVGEEIRTGGLKFPSDAPAMFVGGYEVYRNPIWARRSRDRWLLEQFA
jgi:hypothetical protein